MTSCSFCGKTREEGDVAYIIKRRDGIAICDNCIAICVTAIAKHSAKTIRTLEALIHNFEIGE